MLFYLHFKLPFDQQDGKSQWLIVMRRAILPENGCFDYLVSVKSANKHCTAFLHEADVRSVILRVNRLPILQRLNHLEKTSTAREVCEPGNGRCFYMVLCVLITSLAGVAQN